MEAGKSDVQNHSQLHNELEASLGYMRSCLKKPRSDFVLLVPWDQAGVDGAGETSHQPGREVTQRETGKD